MFKVKSRRSGKVRTVRKVEKRVDDTYFFLWRNGGWHWEDAKWYIPVDEPKYDWTEED